MITPKEAYEQSSVSKKEIMDKFEKDNPEVIVEIERIIYECIGNGKIYAHFATGDMSAISIKAIIDYLLFCGYDAEWDVQKKSIWINWTHPKFTE